MAVVTLINEAVDLYINYLIFEKGLSEKTIESYSRDLARFVSYIISNDISVFLIQND